MRFPVSPTDTSPHQQASTTGETDSITPPAGAEGFFVTVTTEDCYMTVDGSTPSSSNGLRLVAEAGPVFLPIVPAGGEALKFVSISGSASVVNVLFVS